MVQLLLSAVLFCTALVSQGKDYKEYGTYDLKSHGFKSVGKNGEERYSLNADLIDQVVDDLAAHAKDYPPSFRSDDERARAERDAKLLVALFEILAADQNARSDLLLKAAFVDRVAHNLDIDGAAEKAVKNYERLLTREPENPRANMSYGIFLAGTGNPNGSLPYLEKALKLGVDDARYTLGLVYFSLGDNHKATEYLEAYADIRPRDERAKEIISAIKNGTLRAGKGQ